MLRRLLILIVAAAVGLAGYPPAGALLPPAEAAMASVAAEHDCNPKPSDCCQPVEKTCKQDGACVAACHANLLQRLVRADVLTVVYLSVTPIIAAADPRLTGIPAGGPYRPPRSLILV